MMDSDKTLFCQSYNISIRDINYGKHLDHLALLNYLHETRVRYLNSLGVSELNVDGINSGLVVTELNCKYRKECFYGDLIEVKLSTKRASQTRLNFIYHIYREGILAAEAVITTAFISNEHKIIPIPNNLLT